MQFYLMFSIIGFAGAVLALNNEQKRQIYDYFSGEEQAQLEKQFEGLSYQVMPFPEPFYLGQNQYKFLKELGKGQEGTVYLIQNTKTDQRLAIKMYGVSGYPFQPYMAAQAIFDIDNNVVI